MRVEAVCRDKWPLMEESHLQFFARRGSALRRQEFPQDRFEHSPRVCSKLESEAEQACLRDPGFLPSAIALFSKRISFDRNYFWLLTRLRKSKPSLQGFSPQWHDSCGKHRDREERASPRWNPFPRRSLTPLSIFEGR